MLPTLLKQRAEPRHSSGTVKRGHKHQRADSALRTARRKSTTDSESDAGYQHDTAESTRYKPRHPTSQKRNKHAPTADSGRQRRHGHRDSSRRGMCCPGGAKQCTHTHTPHGKIGASLNTRIGDASRGTAAFAPERELTEDTGSMLGRRPNQKG